MYATELDSFQGYWPYRMFVIIIIIIIKHANQCISNFDVKIGFKGGFGSYVL